MQIQKFPLDLSTQLAQGRFLLYIEDVSWPKAFKRLTKRDHIVSLPPNSFAGNHKHKRTEVVLGLHPDLEFVWQDEKGKKHIEKMNPDGKLQLIYIPSYVPHAVVNKSATSPAVFYEWTDSADVEREVCNLVS